MSAVEGKPVIGRVERVSFPEWNLQGMEAKMDTGAYTSSLHCTEIKVDSKENRVRFHVPGGDGEPGTDLTAELAGRRIIRSSNGLAEERVIVVTSIQIGKRRFRIELSLTDRSDMRFPVLIGRRFLKNKFLVDVSKKFMIGESWRDAR